MLFSFYRVSGLLLVIGGWEEDGFFYLLFSVLYVEEFSVVVSF